MSFDHLCLYTQCNNEIHPLLFIVYNNACSLIGLCGDDRWHQIGILLPLCRGYIALLPLFWFLSLGNCSIDVLLAIPGSANPDLGGIIDKRLYLIIFIPFSAISLSNRAACVSDNDDIFFSEDTVNDHVLIPESV